MKPTLRVENYRFDTLRIHRPRRVCLVVLVLLLLAERSNTRNTSPTPGSCTPLPLYSSQDGVWTQDNLI